MKKWKFSLESVRALKSRLEEQAAQKHIHALVQASHAKALLQQTEKALEEAARSTSLKKQKVSATELLQLNQYINLLGQQQIERQNGLREAEKLVALARARLETVGREREILDRLQDRRKAEHNFYVRRQEQKWLDEMAQQMKRGLLRPA